VGWGKVACWSTKAAISLKRVKIEEKLLWRAYRNSPTLFRVVPSPSPYGLPFPKIGVSQPPLKTPIAIISGTGKATDFKCGQYTFTGSIRTKAHEIFWRKGSVGVSSDCQKILGTPYYLRNGKATNFKFGWTIHSVHPNKSPLKILEKREHRHIQGLPKFFGVPVIISGTGKATNFQFCRHNRSKSPLRISGKVAVYVVTSQGHPKTFRAPIYRAHRAISFAIAQLSCIIQRVSYSGY